jgi:hypothetical protein
MSENKSRFRMKKGDIEIEYEGTSSEVSSKFSEIFDWLRAVPATSSPLEQGEGVLPKPSGEQKQEKRGGARSAVISPAIDELVKEGFLDAFKNANQVYEELKRKTVPVSGANAVIKALNRRVPKTLDRIKDDQGKWVYRKKT